ncbi:hypothetical protein [Brucella pseudogrignonensis]|uniref:hypothetical protein n=1 Tax=Brucella pseudogrignonensis TaxID=419475 RepID=UPI000B9928B6|nr:hypothetical protein [Brucella pseudogrignonensis]NKX15792.1 hypothetical protein [Brucella pseudogrignonensis]
MLPPDLRRKRKLLRGNETQAGFQLDTLMAVRPERVDALTQDIALSLEPLDLCQFRRDEQRQINQRRGLLNHHHALTIAKTRKARFIGGNFWGLI